MNAAARNVVIETGAHLLINGNLDIGENE